MLIMLYHFIGHKIGDIQKDMRSRAIKNTKFDPWNDPGNIMIQAILGYLTKLETNYENYGVIVYFKKGFVIIGALLYSINDNKCTIHRLGVTKEYRRQNIGTKMVEFLELYLKIVNVKEISLYSSDELYTIKFYKKLGFEIVYSTNMIKHLK